MPVENPLAKRELPLFPLPVVLFPGALLPLHIFEERYKLMIKDCLETDKMFGVTYHTERDSWPPTIGRIGAIAQIMAVVPLDDGKMNILTVGATRYRSTKYIEVEPYLKADVELFQDEPDDHDNAKLMVEVKKLYDRASTALKEINDEQLPDLPEMPEEFSFVVASILRLQDMKKQNLLELRSTGVRLNRLRQHLSSIIDQYELRAQVHGIAKRNGHGSHSIMDELKDKLQ
jgi:ATP-dependent Lon protease